MEACIRHPSTDHDKRKITTKFEEVKKCKKVPGAV
jgi:hypothetical protein